MHEEIGKVTKQIGDIRDSESNQDHVGLQTNEYSRDEAVIQRKHGKDAKQLDDRARRLNPLFMPRFLEELAITYLELDNLMLKKADKYLPSPPNTSALLQTKQARNRNADMPMPIPFCNISRWIWLVGPVNVLTRSRYGWTTRVGMAQGYVLS
jgi:hypothetical protein